MNPEILTIDHKVLVGLKVDTSFSENKTAELWRTFMPKKSLINPISNDLFSVEVYPDLDFFKTFDPSKTFEKWAAVEVASLDDRLEEFEVLSIPKGLYAKFAYLGKASDAAKFYAEIYSNWLPNSEFTLANRPHFAIMSEKYKGKDFKSKENIFIPIERKA